MEAIRLALKTWALAVLNQDMDELADILHEDFLFNDDMGKERYVEVYGPVLDTLSITEINQSLAYFDHVGEDFEVAPVVTTSGLFKTGFKLVFRSTIKGWKVHRIYPDQEVPSQLLDVDLPEKHLLHSVYHSILREIGFKKNLSSRVVRTECARRNGWPGPGFGKKLSWSRENEVWLALSVREE